MIYFTLITAVSLSAHEPKLLQTINGHTSFVGSVVFSPNGKSLASGGCDGNVNLWDVATGENIFVNHIGCDFGNYYGTHVKIAFSSDGRTLAAVKYNDMDGIKLIDVSSGKVIDYYKCCFNNLSALAYSPDGKMLAYGCETITKPYPHVIELWDVASKKHIASLYGHIDDIWCVVFSPDGKTLASCSHDTSIRLWDVATKKNIAILENTAILTHCRPTCSSVAFSPDGKILASDCCEKIVLRDVPSGKIIDVFRGHKDTVMTVAFSPDGKTLASGGYDGEIMLWDVATGKSTTTIKAHEKSLLSVAFSPDGKMLASGSRDGTIMLWDLKPSCCGCKEYVPERRPRARTAGWH